MYKEGWCKGNTGVFGTPIKGSSPFPSIPLSVWMGLLQSPFVGDKNVCGSR